MGCGQEAGRAWCQGALASGMGSFSGGWILGNDDDSLLLLADNYIQQMRTEPQRHRDVLGAILGSLQRCDLCGPQASCARQPVDHTVSLQGYLIPAPGSAASGQELSASLTHKSVSVWACDQGSRSVQEPFVWQSAKFNKFYINAHILDNSKH